MRAMVLREQGPAEEGPLQEQEVEDPRPEAGEVLLRVLACGVCHTDLHIVEGDLPLPRCPLIPGHQIVGEVIARGDGVESPAVGSRVGVPWLSSTCGSCRHCEADRENLCEDARFTGWDRDGGFAERVTAPASAVHPLPEGYSDEEAAPLLCAGIIGYRSLRVCGVEPGQTLGLFGFGASAHLTLQVARHRDVEVLVFTRSEEHREVALDLGAAWAGGAEDEAPASLQAAISFAPAGWVARAAMGHLDRGGTLAINAIHLDSLPELDYQDHLYYERGLRSVTNLTHGDAREFLEVAGETRLQTVVETWPLEEANEVLRRLSASELEAAAALAVGSREGC